MSKNSWLGVIRNIPSSFHSSDLRSFFSQLIEEKGFDCFHYKHRPEILLSTCTAIEKNDTTSSGISTADNCTPSKQTCVCVVSFSSEYFRQRCVNIYNNKNWINQGGDYLKAKCLITICSLSATNEESTVQDIYLTERERKHRKRHAVNEFLSVKDLLLLSELNPPVKVMPNGNVGTSVTIFQELIRQCALPSSVIKRLGLNFSLTGSNRRYGKVPFSYGDDPFVRSSEKTFFQTASGSVIASVNIGQDQQNLSQIDEDVILKDNKSKESNSRKEHINNYVKEEDHDSDCKNDDDREDDNDDRGDSDDDDDDGEEWDRHEALHNDVTTQERSKERLFEEKIELKWEKGGSGLVFYTDAQYWAEEEGDFDEQTTDDWDVDTSEFYGLSGDKDAKDFIQISEEKRLRNGMKTKHTSPRKTKTTKRIASINQARFGDFEKYTNGFGRKIMEKMGWKDGKSLGSREGEGLLEPLFAEGQSSREKSGFGYHGEKINRPTWSASMSQRPQDQPSTSKMSSHRVSSTNQFPRHQSVEPLASHSYLFPQFRSNLTSLYSKLRFDNRSRRKAVPGRDGIVITTVFDDPLDVDQDSGIFRSQPSTGLKRRHSSDTSNKVETIETVSRVTGSKLVKRVKESSNELGISYPASMTSFASVKFVRPSNPTDRFS